MTAAVVKAKTPLIVGSAAIAGVAGGLAVRAQHKRSRSLAGRLGAAASKRGKAVDLNKMRKNVDFDKLAETAQKVGTYGRQVGDVANAVERASKVAKKNQ